MKGKQLFGFVLLSMGVTLMVFAAHGMGFLSRKPRQAQGLTNSPLSPTDYYPENAELPPATDGLKWLIIGAICVSIGGFVVIRYRENGA